MPASSKKKPPKKPSAGSTAAPVKSTDELKAELNDLETKLLELRQRQLTLQNLEGVLFNAVKLQELEKIKQILDYHLMSSSLAMMTQQIMAKFRHLHEEEFAGVPGKESQKSIDTADSDLRPDNAKSDTLVTHAEIKLSEVALTNFYMNTFSMMACFGAMSVYLNANRSLLVSGSVNIALAGLLYLAPSWRIRARACYLYFMISAFLNPSRLLSSPSMVVVFSLLAVYSSIVFLKSSSDLMSLKEKYESDEGKNKNLVGHFKRTLALDTTLKNNDKYQGYVDSPSLINLRSVQQELSITNRIIEHSEGQQANLSLEIHRLTVEQLNQALRQENEKKVIDNWLKAEVQEEKQNDQKSLKKSTSISLTKKPSYDSLRDTSQESDISPELSPYLQCIPSWRNDSDMINSISVESVDRRMLKLCDDLGAKLGFSIEPFRTGSSVSIMPNEAEGFKDLDFVFIIPHDKEVRTCHSEIRNYMLKLPRVSGEDAEFGKGAELQVQWRIDESNCIRIKDSNGDEGFVSKWEFIFQGKPIDLTIRTPFELCPPISTVRMFALRYDKYGKFCDQSSAQLIVFFNRICDYRDWVLFLKKLSLALKYIHAHGDLTNKSQFNEILLAIPKLCKSRDPISLETMIAALTSEEVQKEFKDIWVADGVSLPDAFYHVAQIIRESMCRAQNTSTTGLNQLFRQDTRDKIAEEAVNRSNFGFVRASSVRAR